MQEMMRSVRESTDSFAVCSATPRAINGRPSTNPRYLQTRPDLTNPLNKYVAAMGTRLFRAVPADRAVRIPVHSVLVGRRNNPADYEKGREISGLDAADALEDVKVFHAGTRLEDGRVLSDGGRVLGVTSLGATISLAKLQAYKGVKEIRWRGAWCRKDISDKALQ